MGRATPMVSLTIHPAMSGTIFAHGATMHGFSFLHRVAT
jgi:hypothetical protein